VLFDVDIDYSFRIWVNRLWAYLVFVWFYSGDKVDEISCTLPAVFK